MKLLAKITLLLVSFSVLGQQETQFSQYYNNAYLINPAASGLSKTLQLDAGYRFQYTGIDGAPSSFYFSGNSEFKIGKGKKEVLEEFNTDGDNFYENPTNSVGKTKHVIGGKIMNDQIGPFIKNSVFGTYGYHLPFSKTIMLGLGLGAGISNLSIDPSRVVLLEEDDLYYNSFVNQNSNQNIFDLQGGITMYGEKFEFGLSATQLVKNKFAVNEIITNSRFTRHLFFYGLYKIEMNEILTFEPHFLLQRTGNSPTSFNLGGKFYYENKFWANLSYRFGNSISLGAGLNFGRNFSFGYSYDANMGPLQNATGSAHEIHLGFILGANRNVKKELEDGEKE